MFNRIRSAGLGLLRSSTSVCTWWAICLVWAAILSWDGRNSMGPDGLSYLDMASETLKCGPKALVNGYWSPAYPAVLAFALSALQPSSCSEFPIVHLVNFAIFTAALWSYSFFLRALIRYRTGGSANESEAEYLVPLGFGIFLWFLTQFISFPIGTPDVCTAVTIFFAAGILCGISRRASDPKRYIALGVVLGFGYYTKTVMLPLGLVLLALVFLWPPERRLCRRKLVLTALIFLAVVAPSVVLLSSRFQRFSIGEAGRLNYVWYVTHRELLAYDGAKGRFGDAYNSLTHPPRRLIERPLTLEFATPVSGTFPLWYDPSYWWEGVKLRFVVGGQWEALKENLRVYAEALARMKSLVVVFLGLCLLAAHRKTISMPDRSVYWLFLWPVAACSVYGLVLVEYRHIIAFCILFWLALFRHLLRGIDNLARGIIVGGVLCALFFTSAGSLVSVCTRTVRNLYGAIPADHVRVAEALKSLGVNPNDCLASIGRRFDIASNCAHCAGARIVAEISDEQTYWHLSAPELANVSDRLAGVGIRAIIAIDRPIGVAKAGWMDVSISGHNRVSILPLRVH